MTDDQLERPVSPAQTELEQPRVPHGALGWLFYLVGVIVLLVWSKLAADVRHSLFLWSVLTLLFAWSTRARACLRAIGPFQWQMMKARRDRHRLFRLLVEAVCLLGVSWLGWLYVMRGTG